MKHIKPYLGIISLVSLGFAPIVFFVASLKFDMIDISLPWRFFIGKAIQNGEYPFWNPFINYGFPQISEPQTWYPIALVFQLVSKYTLFDLHLEFTFHLFLAAIGFYHLAKNHKLKNFEAAIFGVIYTFSGFFVGNAQHFGWIISAAWLPWTWFLFLNLLHTKNKWPIFLLPVVLYCFLTGGYPAFFVTNLYCMVGYFGWHLWKSKLSLKQLQKPIIAGLFFSLLAIGMLYSFFQIQPLITRGNTLSWEALGIGSLSLKSLISVVAPLLVTTKYQMWDVLDYGLTNMFLGFGILFMLTIGLVKTKNNSWWFQFALGLFFLWMALGPDFILLKVLAKIIPFVDVFRFPALYRIFTIFFWIWLAFKIYQVVDFKAYKKVLMFFPVGLLLMAFLCFLWMHKASFWDGFPLPEGYKVWTISQRAFVWFLISGFAVGITILLFRKSETKRLLLLMVLTEFLVHVCLYGPVSIYYWDSTQEAEQYLQSTPSGFQTENQNTITQNTFEDQLPQTSFLWRNKAHYTMNIAADGYSPYVFFSLEKLQKSQQYEYLKTKPFFYLKYENGDLEITQFSPNKFEIEVNSWSSDTLIFQQNYFAGWEASIHQNPVKIEKAFGTFMKIPISKGYQNVVFEFKPLFKSWLFYLPFAGCFLLLGLGFWLFIRGF